MQASEFNLIDFAKTYGQVADGEYFESQNIKWSYTGSKILNRTFDLNSDEQEVDSLIQKVIQEFKKRKAPFIWIVGPSTIPQNVGENLIRNGFELRYIWSGMEASIKDIKTHEDYDEIIIKEVEDENQIREYITVANKGLSLGFDINDAFQIVFQQKENNKSSLSYFLAYYNDCAVSSAAVYIDKNNVAGLYYVATLPEYRRKGFASQLLFHIMGYIQGKGCQRVVLHASEMGEPLYRKMGFDKLCEYRVYGWSND